MLDRGDQEGIYSYMLSKGIDLQFNGETQLRSFWGCIGAVALVVGTTTIGVGMLAKIKNFIVTAGGVKSVSTALTAIAKSGASAENLSKFGAILLEMRTTILEVE